MMPSGYLKDWVSFLKLPKSNWTVPVPCRPLGTIVANSMPTDAPHPAAGDLATFLSLDVQGAEAQVLATVDPAAFKVIMVENDGYSPRKDALVHARILHAGLRETTRVRVRASRVYVRADVQEVLLADLPAWNLQRNNWGLHERVLKNPVRLQNEIVNARRVRPLGNGRTNYTDDHSV